MFCTCLLTLDLLWAKPNLLHWRQEWNNFFVPPLHRQNISLPNPERSLALESLSSGSSVCTLKFFQKWHQLFESFVNHKAACPQTMVEGFFWPVLLNILNLNYTHVHQKINKMIKLFRVGVTPWLVEGRFLGPNSICIIICVSTQHAYQARGKKK